MSAEVLGNQFVKRRAAQLAQEGRSLVRPAPPAQGTEAASRAAHPAGMGRPLRAVVGEADVAASAVRREMEQQRVRAALAPRARR